MPLLTVMLAVPFGIAAWFGQSLQVGKAHYSPLFAPVFLGILLGGPSAAVSVRAWRIQRAKVLEAAPAVDLGLFAPTVPAREAVRPTPWAHVPELDDASAGTNRFMRRARTLLISAALCAYLVARVLQARGIVSGSSSDEVPTLVLGLFAACACAAGVLTLVLRARWRRSGRGRSIRALAIERGWRVASSDSGQLATRFPRLPLLRATSSDDAVRQKGVVWGTAGDRRWWAVDQAGTYRNAQGMQRSKRETVVIVLLPGVVLPEVVVAAGVGVVRARGAAPAGDGAPASIPSRWRDHRDRPRCPGGVARRSDDRSGPGRRTPLCPGTRGLAPRLPPRGSRRTDRRVRVRPALRADARSPASSGCAHIPLGLRRALSPRT
jgi:hypothetical protein